MRMQRLSQIKGLRIFGRAPDKGPIVAFKMDGAHAHDIATIIDRSGVAVRAGTHCAMPLLAHFGATSTCRASFALYNTREEIDGLAEALRQGRRPVFAEETRCDDAKAPRTAPFAPNTPDDRSAPPRCDPRTRAA